MNIDNMGEMIAELPDEILFDYSKAKPNRFAIQEEVSVTLEPNVAATQEALDAVHRLTTLFADVRLANLEKVLHDPMLELANSDLDTGLGTNKKLWTIHSIYLNGLA